MNLFKKNVLALLVSLCSLSAMAESHVYLIFDVKATYKEQGKETVNLCINGDSYPFKLGFNKTMNTPSSGTFYFYKQTMQEIVFEKEGRYNISIDFLLMDTPYHAEMVLNVEDGENYYVETAATMKTVSLTEMPTDKGAKRLEKIKKDKNFSICTPFTYEK